MPGTPYVYVDMLFLINFLMDYVVLWAAARLAQVRIVPLRLGSAAFSGALYSVLVLLPGFKYLSVIWIKFLMSLLMLAIGFIPLTWKKFSQLFLYFYLIAFTMGGAVLGFIYFISNVSLHPAFGNLPLPYLWLAVALGTAILLGKWGTAFLQKTFLQTLLKVPVRIKMQGHEVKVDGLVDTGNQLVDPLTGAPVIIVEYDVLAPFLPASVKNIFSSGGEVDAVKLSESFQAEGWLLPFRLIPFTTIGKRHGMLVGFKPTEVSIFTGDQQVRKNNVVVGIYSRRLSPKGTYRALLHPDLLHASANS
ncbi:MAG: sigma-E processing peptidase SpoIIGA [Bacillota bacterium]|nr:sigma-E processing peptidase SpoIIGA [Bacillota bacterium]